MAFRSFFVLGLSLVLLQLHAAAGKRAAYFMENAPAGNNLVSLEIDSKTGLFLLSSPVLTPTGGKGRSGMLSPTVVAGPDALFAQNAIVVEGNYLFVVNPGSNTLSMFYIPEDDPFHPILVGKPADTLGEFPISVAYSSKLEIACVLNSGAKAGVTCYCVTEGGLIALDTSPRSISAHSNQTTPPSGPPLTASDVLFNPSSTALFVTIKGTPPATLGAIYVWPVVEGKVSSDPVISTPAGVLVEFGSVFLGGDDRLYVTDAASGGAIVDVSSSFEVTVEATTVIAGAAEGAPCWANYAPKFESVYVMQVMQNNITVVDPKTAAITGYLQFPATAVGPGGFDAAIDRDWLYVLAGDPGVLVFQLDIDVGKSKFVQKIDLSSLGSRKAWEGMAIFH